MATIQSQNTCAVTLYITPQYEISPFLKKASPEETEYILDYGENLLREHQTLINKGILDERIEGLTKTLQDKALEAQELNSKLKIAQQEAQSITIQYSKQVDTLKQEIQTIKIQADVDMNNQLKAQLQQQSQQYDIKIKQLIHDNEKDIAALRNKYSNEVQLETERLNQQLMEQVKHNTALQKKIESEREQQSNQYDIKIKQIIQDNEKDIAALRNKYSNDVQLETERLNQQLMEQIKQNTILNKKIENEREQIYTLTDKIRKDVMTELYDRNTLEKELVKNEIKDSYITTINQLENRINEMKNEMKEKEQCLLDVGKIVKYYEFENTSVKGAKGEHKVQEIIKSLYKTSIITDTSGTPHAGDLRLTIDNLNCLIEVKNKKYVSEDDVKKFLSDVDTNKKLINCALFISLESENIPTKGNFHIEIINTMPVIYIYKYDNSSISFAIESLFFFIDKFSKLTKKSLKDEEVSTGIVNVIKNTNKTIKKESARINTIIKHLERQVSQLQITKKNLIADNINIQTFFNNVEIEIESDSPDEKEEKEEDPKTSNDDFKYSEEDMLKIKNWIITNKKKPTRVNLASILEITQYEVDKRGTKILNLKSFINKTFREIEKNKVI